MKRAFVAAFATIGLSVAIGFSAYSVSAVDTTTSNRLTPEMVSSANQAVLSSAALSNLSGGRPFTIRSTGEWKTVGELSGAAMMIDYGDVVQLNGQWPVMDVLNPVSEADKARGVPDPEKLDIRFTKRQMSASAQEFAVLVDLEGEIKNISTVPPRAPAPAIELGVTPPTYQASTDAR